MLTLKHTLKSIKTAHGYSAGTFHVRTHRVSEGQLEKTAETSQPIKSSPHVYVGSSANSQPNSYQY